MENERVHRSCSQDCCASFSSERDRVKSRIFADASTRSWNLSSVLISSRYRTSRLVEFRASKPRLSASCFTSVGNRLKSRSINSFGGFRRPEFGGKSRGSNNNDSLVLEPPAQVCDGGSISHNVTHDKHPGSCFHFSIKHRLAKSE